MVIGIILSIIGLFIILCSIIFDEHLAILFGAILFMIGLGLCFDEKESPVEKTIKATEVRIDTTYTIMNGVIDTTYIVTFIEKH